VQVPVAAGASTSEVERAVERAREQATALAVPTDGLVLKVDEVKWQARLGNGPLAPRWAVARKFSPPGGTTTLRRVVWEVGRLGTLTPVAEFDAVKIDGTQVRRASLHHAGEVRRRDLHVGDRIDVAKAGKIIPVVARVWADERQSDAVPVVPPEHCPVCDAGLEQVGDAADNLRCPNFDCAEQRKRRLQHFASKRALAIRGLGPGMAEKLIAHNLVRTPADLYRLNTEQLTMLPGVGERTAEKLVAAIAASREQPRWRLLAGVGMPGIGPESARQLAAEIGALRDLLAASDIAARESPTAEPWREPHWRETIQALVDAGW
jgi:DNA ligase (NAD+)